MELSQFQRNLKNKHIKIIPIKSNFYNLKTEEINVFAYNYGIITPLFINVLVLLLWHAIKRKASHIEIYGADFSAFKELSVNQSTNELSSLFSHFYKNTKAQANTMQKYPGKKRKKIHMRLFQIWNSFYQMYLLSVITKKLKIKVINYSSNSYLILSKDLNKKMISNILKFFFKFTNLCKSLSNLDKLNDYENKGKISRFTKLKFLHKKTVPFILGQSIRGLSF